MTGCFLLDCDNLKLLVQSYNLSINNRGQVIMQTGLDTFLWEDGSGQWIRDFFATHLNNQGEMVGYALFFTQASHGGFYLEVRQGTWRDNERTLYQLGTTINGMNDAGTITGTHRPSGSYSPFDWKHPPFASLGSWSSGESDDMEAAFVSDGTTLIPLGSFAAWAINNLGQVAGTSYRTNFAAWPVFWDGTDAINLGTLPGEIRAVASDTATE
jgi:hypothetical protein